MVSFRYGSNKNINIYCNFLSHTAPFNFICSKLLSTKRSVPYVCFTSRTMVMVKNNNLTY